MRDWGGVNEIFLAISDPSRFGNKKEDEDG
jgi:hypothetical protein